MDENIKNFIYAGTGGIISRTMTAPLERLKVLYQNKKDIRTSYHSYLYNLVKKEGILSLFNGNGVNCLRIFPESAIRYSCFDYTKKNLEKTGINKNLIFFLSGSIGGIVASTVTYPIETMRTKLSVQSNKNMYNGIVDCAIKTYTHKGIRGFYGGCGITAFGMIPFQGTNFLTYEFLKNRYEPTNINLLLFGSIAGFTSITCSYPFDILKRKLQLSNELGNPKYDNPFHCIRYIYSQNGIRGFYAGLIPCYMKLIPANCIFFYTVEVLKNIY